MDHCEPESASRLQKSKPGTGLWETHAKIEVMNPTKPLSRLSPGPGSDVHFRLAFGFRQTTTGDSSRVRRLVVKYAASYVLVFPRSQT